VFKELDDEQPTIILNRNRSIGVVIKPSVYETIMEDLEDLYAAERLDELVKKKDEIDFASWEELEQKLIKVGKLRPS
jgi:PHD/YefM family antitoxin component YafN of YafNO toxin-antitoxin module